MPVQSGSALPLSVLATPPSHCRSRLSFDPAEGGWQLAVQDTQIDPGISGPRHTHLNPAVASRKTLVMGRCAAVADGVRSSYRRSFSSLLEAARTSRGARDAVHDDE